MDPGAHFRKCDFQVHSPRDIRWSGGDAVTDAERKAYAEELIQACREKGLGAIAITDHHDFAFFPYIKKAAEDEVDSVGHPIPSSEGIVVFPGLELTLTAPNCQAILILDANFPENLLQSVLTVLAITPAPSVDSKHHQTHRIPQNVVSDLGDLYSKLNSHEHLKGRFIVFPNVSETGSATLLRSGFGNFYKHMPCVGGYTDGSATNFGTGNMSILSGQNRDYGFKSIAVFQTSDNRKRGHSELGKHTTWVKWSEPTAEALRQACLAKESRLTHDTPDLPRLWVASMSVSNSKFLGRVNVEFNQQYNAVIGGRGTGKSTILEYLRWGLCDQPVDADSDISAVQVKRKKLIDDTLEKLDGEVTVTFLLNDVQHILKRSSKTHEIVLKIGDASFVQTTENEVRNLFPAQAYSQKQLSSVAVRIDELRRFVEVPIKHPLDQIRSEIRDTEAKLRAAYGKLIRKKEIETEIAKYTLESTSLTEQLGALRQGLKGLSEADQKIISRKSAYDKEELLVDELKNELARAADLVKRIENEYHDNVRQETDFEDIENTTLLKQIAEKYSAKLSEIERQISALANLFESVSLKDIDDQVSGWQKIRDDFQIKYEAAKARAKVNAQQLKQIADVETRIAELKRLQLAKRNALTALGDPDTAYKELRNLWDNLHLRKIELLKDRCKQFSALSDKVIKAELERSLDIDVLKKNLKIAFAGLNIKEQKIDDICERLSAAGEPVRVWNTILSELETLSLHDTAGTDPLPSSPTLDRCGLIGSEKTRLAAGLESERWLNLSVTELQFNPVFRYCTNKSTDEYIDFADASAGQQATALLSVLLNQEGAPLIIDQPEDDIDSKMSPTIVKQIWTAKTRRQLIYASHNANFVVNGDAELVICCDYIKAGDQTGGQIKASGAIDNLAIKEEITNVTEGGRQAFKLRMEKYGF
jgi:type III restriction enzyme